MRGRSRPYAPWLWLLCGLFLFRVVAQPLALLPGGLSWLPGFESWHGGLLPYPLLLLAQLLILAWLVRTAGRFATGEVEPNRRIGVPALIFGGVYFAVMLLRLILGASILSGERWFASPLPAFFHLVLAGFLLLYGHFHFRHGVGGRHEESSG